MGITLALGVTTAAKTIDSDREGAMVGAGPLSEQPGVHQNYLTHRNGSSMSSSFKQNNISSTQQPLNRGTLGQATVRMTQESESEIEVFNIINQISSTTNETELELQEEPSQSNRPSGTQYVAHKGSATHLNIQEDSEEVLSSD